MEVDGTTDNTPIVKVEAQSPIVLEFLQWCSINDINGEIYKYNPRAEARIRVSSTLFYQIADDFEDDFEDISSECEPHHEGFIRWARYSWHIKAEFLPAYQQVKAVLPDFSMKTLCSLPEGTEVKPGARGEDDDFTDDDFDPNDPDLDTTEESTFGWSDSDDDEYRNPRYLNKFDPPTRQYNPHMIEWKRNCGDKNTRLSIEERTRVLRNIPAWVDIPLDVLPKHGAAIREALLKYFGPDCPCWRC